MNQQKLISQQNTGTVYHVLDLTKFIGALLVVLIHTEPLESHSAVANFYTTDVLARLAVPMFFAISGFFYARRPAPIKTFQRIGMLYLGWSAAYLLIQLPQWYASGWWGPHVILDYVLGLVTKGSYYHLWYLLATLYAIPLLYLLVKRDSPQLIMVVCCLCWLAECLTYSYSWIGLNQIGLLVSLLDRFSGVCDGIFRALPLMLVGALCFRNAATHPAPYWGKRALVGFVLLCTESSILYFATPNSGFYSYLFTTPVFTYYLLCFLLTCGFRFRRADWPILLRKASLIIYCIHPFFDYFVKRTTISPGIPAWLAVTVLSVGFSLAYSSLSLQRRSK